MIVPIDLLRLSIQKGYLSPELSLGWRIGSHVREFFDGLEDVRVAARSDTDAVLALSSMTRCGNFPGTVTMASKDKPWDFLFYHPITGTALLFNLVPDRTELPPDIRALESRISDQDSTIMAVYRGAVDTLVKRILCEPLANLCCIREIRLRRIQATDENRFSKLRCPWCGLSIAREDLWDVNGVSCCFSCSCLENSWFVCH